MAIKEDKFLFNRQEISVLFSVTPPTFDRWNIAPLEKKGGAKIFDARTVVQQRLNEAKGQQDDVSLAGQKARLAKAQAEAKELENAERRGELLPANVILSKWENELAALRAQLMTLPVKLAQSSIELQTAHDVEELARELVYECLEELSTSGIPENDNEDVDESEEDAESTTPAESQRVG